ncbi:MAG: hypothetical protein ABIQ95_05070, partial [Bdellovibrionia bacterium]
RSQKGESEISIPVRSPYFILNIFYVLQDIVSCVISSNTLSNNVMESVIFMLNIIISVLSVYCFVNPAHATMEDDFDLYSSITLQSIQTIKNPRNFLGITKSQKALKNAEEIEKILISDESMPLRAKIIEKAKETELALESSDESDSKLRYLSQLAGTRKVKFHLLFLNSLIHSALLKLTSAFLI